MKDNKRIPTDADGQPFVWQSPFAALKSAGLPPPPAARQGADGPDQTDAASTVPGKNRGRVDILRHTAHRGGKTVTVVTGFLGISQAEKNQLAKAMQHACGAGGTVKEGRIEIQGDHRKEVARILTNAGFRPVFAGG
jgi:translation initiation factor 1